MADQQTHAPGGHYSGRNKIPNIKEFVSNLDRDKAERDRQLDEQKKVQQQQERAQAQGKPPPSDVQDHQPFEMGVKGTQKKVTDPTTGREVVIEDVNEETMENVKNPMVKQNSIHCGCDWSDVLTDHCAECQHWERYGELIEATLYLHPADDGQPIKTDASQSNDEYKHNQDVTAPPDPVAEGTTSDLPIHGEKTNILFHPTPSVSYEPTFKSLEKKAGGLCVGLLLAIVILGKMFGGSLKGLIPLGCCVSSGVWLWAQEVVRSGREVEWDSEKTRGRTVSPINLPVWQRLTQYQGNREPST